MDLPAELLVKPLDRKQRFRFDARGHELALAWAATAVFGALWITYASTTVGRHIVPVGAMLAYLAFGLTRRARNTARLADSLYFLGFLWTLYALIAHLILAKRGVKADAIFTIFGYALVTTAAGMFLRMLLIQFQRTVSDQIVEAKEEVDAGVSAFGEELKRAELTVSQFSRTAIAALEGLVGDMSVNATRVRREFEESQRRLTEETSADFRKAVERIIEQMHGIQRAATEVGQGMSKFAEDFDVSVKGISTSVARVRTTLDRRIDAFDQTLTRVVSRLEAIEAPPDLLAGAIQRISKEFEGRSRELTAGLADMVAAVQDKMGELSRAVLAAPGSEEVSRALSDWEGAIVSLTRRYVELDAASAAIVTSITDAAGATEGLRASVARLNSSIEAETGKHLVAAEEVVRELKVSAVKVDDSVRDAVRFLSQHIPDGR